MTTTLPAFTEVAQALETLASLGTAAESHGLLCALISFNNQIREKAWVDSLLAAHIEPGNSAAEKAYQCLTLLFRETVKAFDVDSFDLPILLPDDDLPLIERIDGLSEWCQGYLTGLHLMGFNLEKPPAESPDLKEALDDLLAISQVEMSREDEKDPQSELRFIELVEHVKAAVLLISTELKAKLAPRNHATVH